jgi:hypothetical protein
MLTSRIDAIEVTASLAFETYKACSLSFHFQTLANDVGCFRSLLDLTVEKVKAFSSEHRDIEYITRTVNSCFKCLQEVASSISRFNDLPTASQRAWERTEWGSGELTELRGRLGTSIGLLNTLNTQLVR